MTRVTNRTLILWVIAGTCCGCQSPSQHTPFRLQPMFSAKGPSAQPDAFAAADASNKLPNPATLFGKKPKTPHDQMRDMKHPALASQPNSVPGKLAKRTMDSVRGAFQVESQDARSLDPTHLLFDPGELQPELYLSAAQLMEQRGQLAEAAAHYEHLLTLEPSNRAALIGAPRLAHRMGNLDQAIAGYQRALAVVGQDPVVLNDLGLCLARAGRHPEAVQTLQTALAGNPASLMYRNNLAAVLVESQRTDEAVAVLAETHGPAVAHYNVGYMLQQREQYERAQGHFERVLEIHPEFPPAVAMLEKISPRLGQRPVRTTPYSAAQPGPAQPIGVPQTLPTAVRAGGDWPAQPLPDVVRYPRTPQTGSPTEITPPSMVVPVQHLADMPEIVLVAAAAEGIEPAAGRPPLQPDDISTLATVQEPELADRPETESTKPAPAANEAPTIDAAAPELAGAELADGEFFAEEFSANQASGATVETTEAPALAQPDEHALPQPEPAPAPVIRQPTSVKSKSDADALIAPSPDNFDA